jgi:hypothetical protein
MGESRSQRDDAATRALSAEEAAYVAAARDATFVRYEGVRVPHRSCGISIAETFGVPTRAYQALRRGGITGEGTCGAIRAGEQVLGELLGDPDPGGAVTAPLRAAIRWYQDAHPARVDLGGAPDLVCNNLVRTLGDFTGPRRAAFCTHLAAEVAALTAEALVRFAPEPPAIAPVPSAAAPSPPREPGR